MLAPIGRDAALIDRTLGADAIACTSIPTIAELCERINDDIGAAIIFEEALAEIGMAALVEKLQRQPSWSELPLIVLTASAVSDAMSRIYARLSPDSYITLIQRPLHPLTLLTAVRVALRAQARQYELRDQLQHLKLQDEALRKANDELKLSNRDLQQFVYAASHDLKEPLRMIHSYAQLTKRRYANSIEAAGNQFLDSVIDGAARLNQLLDDLLIYSRAARFGGVAPQAIDCNLVVEKTRSNLALAIEESHATIECRRLPIVNAHEAHLIQLFQNLLSNAIRYRDKTRPLHIVIDAAAEAGYWRFCVADNGVGIEVPYRKKVFELFQRLHAAPDSGSGIGLALCARIVEQYGGKIWVEDADGVGARFNFTLPRNADAAID